MNNSAILHIILTISGIAVLYTLVHPMYLDSMEVNRSITEVNQALEQAATANQALQAKVSEYNSVTKSNRDRLDTYLPEQIDELRNLSNILSIANVADVTINSYSAEMTKAAEAEVEYLRGGVSQEQSDVDAATAQGLRIQMSVGGSYEAVKDFLTRAKQNEYPMIIEKVAVGNAEGESVGGGTTDAPNSDDGLLSTDTTIDIQVYIPVFTPGSQAPEPVDDFGLYEADIF